MNYRVNITSEKPEAAPAAAPAAAPSEATPGVKATKREMLIGLAAVVLTFLSTSGIKCSDGLPIIPAGIKVTHGPNFFHLDWPVAPAPAPIPGPTPPRPPEPPVPPSPPAPIVQPIATGQLHATLLLDPNNPSQPLAQLRSDLTIGGALESFNCVPRAYLANESEAVTNGYTVLAQRYPCLIFQDRKKLEDKTAPVVSVIYPTSVAECVAEAKRLRGIQ